jgi:hypothetical protein
VLYTDAADQIGIKFYVGLGFKPLGPAVEWAPGQTVDDLVLKQML